MKNIADTSTATPFEKFKKLTERLMAVPKEEVDKKQAEYERKKKRSKQKKTKK